ncbi:MAG: hypothetical protein R3B09_30085 [Nannocystaceae bacterium]
MSSPRRISELLDAEDERPFLHKAFDARLEDEDRLRYAEVLEARDPARAEWLRLEVALHQRPAEDPAIVARFVALAREVGLDFANLLFRETILNCGGEEAKDAAPRVRFAYACPKRWETLAPPTDADADAGPVRRCQLCAEPVYYCDTVAEAARRAVAGQCIAIPKPLSHGGEEHLVLGRPDPLAMWAERIFPLGRRR